MVKSNRFSEALAVQDACNVSGVARSLVEVIDAARKDPECRSTGDFARDPAVALFVAKLADLCGLAYTWPASVEQACSRRAELCELVALPEHVEITPAVGGGFLLLVRGFQSGPGESDSSGCSRHVFPTATAAAEWYRATFAPEVPPCV